MQHDHGTAGMATTVSSTTTLMQDMRAHGFAFLPAAATAPLLASAGTRGWDILSQSWDDLGTDRYMADGGRYRKRRHAAFEIVDSTTRRKPHQPHYQSRDYNELNGGIARWFQPMADGIGAGEGMLGILRLCHVVFNALTPVRSWHIEVHQFRIEARPGQPGSPTPEGLHQDGVDWVLVLLIRRENVASGVTSIHGADRRRLASFTLADPLDSAWVDDHRVFHGVTAIEPIDPGLPAFRDVLVVTFRRDDPRDGGPL